MTAATTNVRAALERRLATLILSGIRFSADDVTADGALALDPNHDPNALQNAIGAMFRDASRRRLIETVGIVHARAPHRKGGTNRVWIGTETGQLWARSVLA